jgi:mono/diheme cytochrome c family protein
MKKILLTVVIVLALEGLAWTIFVFSGVYNVSLLNHDNAFLNWWLDAGSTRSIKHHAAGIRPPPLDNPAMVQEGFKHYDEMCVQCHGAPGKPPDELSKGLWPEAPGLTMVISDWTPAQLFWITKNGIKFSAMPAWGPTHSDDKIWAITAFLEKLPNLTAADYHEMETNTVGTAKHTE